jgi:hypothetical protein
MTEPDEALLWARERAARWAEGKRDFVELAPSIRLGKWDLTLKDDADAHRAGQAASAERIKALEEALSAWVENECDYMRRNNLGNPEMQHNVIWSRTLLKEADQ